MTYVILILRDKLRKDFPVQKSFLQTINFQEKIALS